HDGEVLAQAGVGGPEGRIADAIALLNTEGSGRGLREHGCVEPRQASGAEIPDGCGAVAVLIPELVAAAGSDACDVLAGSHGLRSSGLVLVDARKFPSAEYKSDEISLVAEERELVVVVRHEHVRAVEVGRSEVSVGIVGVGQDVGEAGAVV